MNIFENPNLLSYNHWKKIGAYNHNGIALPLSAIRNETSSGIGEFLDLIPLIEWCKSIGFDVIQLLPLTDSGSGSSPYSSLSSIALNPIYLSLKDLPYLDLVPHHIEKLKKLAKSNDEERFNYLQVFQDKIAFLKDYFKACFSKISENIAYQDFINENTWLSTYSLFKVLKQHHHDLPWWEWSEEIRNPTPSLIEDLKIKYLDERDFYLLLQYLSFSQWKIVRNHSEKNGVFLKGDLPILINKDSVDVWAERENFILDYAAGAPPDMYSEEGQYWGFPIHNWKYQEKDNYRMWKERLKISERLYHIYRLDHMIGFFRIFAIPLGDKVKNGFYIPGKREEWILQGRKNLTMLLESSTMLPIAEDLGVVLPEMRSTLKEFGIPGTKVDRWERRWNEDKSYIDPKTFIPESMSTVSTHDSEVISEWWATAIDDVLAYTEQRGLVYIIPIEPENRDFIMKECHTSGSLFHINLLQEYLTFFPELVFDDPKNERINIPGTVSEFNWTYRFKPFLSEITHHRGLSSLMKNYSSSDK